MSVYLYLASPNDFRIYLARLTEGIDQGHLLVVKRGCLATKEKNKGFIHRIKYFILANKKRKANEKIIDHLQKIDDVANMLFQSDDICLFTKINLYSKWRYLIIKINNSLVGFNSLAIENFNAMYEDFNLLQSERNCRFYQNQS